MKTYKTSEGFFLSVSDIDIGVTPKEYTMINNIIDRTLKRYDYQIDRITGKIQSYCETENMGCIGCPYKAYCMDVGGNFHQRYQADVYNKLNMSRHVHMIWGDRQDDVLWSNTIEELIRYSEGE